MAFENVEENGKDLAMKINQSVGLNGSFISIKRTMDSLIENANIHLNEMSKAINEANHHEDYNINVQILDSQNTGYDLVFDYYGIVIAVKVMHDFENGYLIFGLIEGNPDGEEVFIPLVYSNFDKSRNVKYYNNYNQGEFKYSLPKLIAYFGNIRLYLDQYLKKGIESYVLYFPKAIERDIQRLSLIPLNMDNKIKLEV